MRLPLGLLLISSTAWARPELCAPIVDPPRWVIAGKQAIACFVEDAEHETCFAVSPAHGPRRVPTPPSATQLPPLPAVAEVRDVGGVPHACVATRCTALGPNLRAAIANAATDEATPKLTIDGRAIALVRPDADGGPREAWDVRRDELLDLSPPPIEGAFGARPMRLDVVDGVMIAEWEGCAGPCAVQTLVDSSGKNIGHWFGAGQPIALDAHRVAIVPMNEDARFVVLETSNARVLSRLSMTGQIDQRRGARYNATTVVAASQDDHAWAIQFIAVPPHEAARFGARYVLPFCRD